MNKRQYIKPHIKIAGESNIYSINERIYDSFRHQKKDYRGVVIECGSYGTALPSDPFNLISLTRARRR